MIVLYEIVARPADRYDLKAEVRFRGRLDKAREFLARVRAEHPDYKIVVHELPLNGPGWARWRSRNRRRRKTTLAL